LIAITGRTGVHTIGGIDPITGNVPIDPAARGAPTTDITVEGQIDRLAPTIITGATLIEPNLMALDTRSGTAAHASCRTTDLSQNKSGGLNANGDRP
jgi:hypothetical protein